jgi:hypothetical protein
MICNGSGKRFVCVAGNQFHRGSALPVGVFAVLLDEDASSRKEKGDSKAGEGACV